MSDLVNDLNSALSTNESQDDNHAITAETLVEQLAEAMDKLHTAFYALSAQGRQNSARLDQMEKYLGYLLSKDPDFSKNVEAHTENK
jgi:hypothetical protein